MRGSDCCGTCTANLIKRWNIYKRDWCGFICQVISPLILVVLGLLLTSQPSQYSQSPERYLSTDLYPHQRILFNNEPIHPSGGEDVSSSEFIANLPNSTEAFSVKVLDNEDYPEFLDFYDKVYDYRDEKEDGDPFPYTYGSFQLFQANREAHLY